MTIKTAFTVTFSPAWWEQNYYSQPGTRIPTDTIDGRREDCRRRDEYLLARYRGVDLAGFRGVKYAYLRGEDYGTVILPGLLGCRIEQNEGGWWAHDADYTDEQLAALEVPDPETTYPLTMVLKQQEALETAVGRENLVNAYETVNVQGPLNIAMKIRGQQFWTDLIEKPEMACAALDVSTRMIEKVVDFFRQRFGPMKVRHDYGYCIAHCPLAMISPAMYEQFVLPYENRLAERTERITGRRDAFELHHCSTTLDPYLDVYKKVNQLSKIDGGDLASDFRRVKRELPGVRIDTGIDSFRARFQRMDEFLRDVHYLADSGVSRISLDVLPEIPDEKILAFLKALKAI